MARMNDLTNRLIGIPSISETLSAPWLEPLPSPFHPLLPTWLAPIVIIAATITRYLHIFTAIIEFHAQFTFCDAGLPNPETVFLMCFRILCLLKE